ncbi:MAG: hypothetical protein LUE93_03860 [Bacteroides sp.]|nr:hypothetical protein [Bacteroides sp.]
MIRGKAKIVWGFLGGLLIVAAAIGIVMALWNALMPAIFGLSTICYWQAAGLILLFRILFGGLGHPHKRYYGHGCAGFDKRGVRGHWPPHIQNVHDRFHEKTDHMSAQEKREFIRRFMCGSPEENAGEREDRKEQDRPRQQR